jgi:glycosyltransferase involved in cell wall biosynthesis
MQISLIITTFNRPDALILVLQSIENQSLAPDEVIIADDGSSESTTNLITDFKKQSSLVIIHSFQEDFGFRAAMSRNKAISRASSDYIILIDGDLILHNEFINDHQKNAKPGYFVQGTRVLLCKDKTKQVLKNHNSALYFFSFGIKNRKNALHSNFLAKLFSLERNSLRGLKTCNVGFYKKDCISVNGFNNKFEGWGREDSEFFVRLMNYGIKRKTLRFNSIQFHLWHKINSRKALLKNDQLLKETINEKLIWCEQGIAQFLKNEKK